MAMIASIQNPAMIKSTFSYGATALYILWPLQRCSSEVCV